MPWQEGFEEGLTHWLTSGWVTATNRAYAGSWSLRNTAGAADDAGTTYHWLVLDRELSLTNVLNPQMTLWFQGKLDSYSHFRVQVSTDGGLNWGDLSVFNVDYGYNSATWTRRQASLQGYTNRTVRLRFQANSFWGSAPYTDFNVDKITIEESPAGVTVNPIDQITVSSMRVTWTEATIENFKEYRVYRSESSTVNESSTLMAIITNKSELSFTDTGLTARKTYFYRVYLYDTTDTGVGSNQSSAMTQGVPVGWTDGFETNQSGWTFTGLWTRQINAGRDGSYALVDSAGGLFQLFGHLCAGGRGSGRDDLAGAEVLGPSRFCGRRLGPALGSPSTPAAPGPRFMASPVSAPTGWSGALTCHRGKTSRRSGSGSRSARTVARRTTAGTLTTW